MGFRCSLEALPPVAVGLVRHRRTQHAVADLLAVDVRLELGLESCDPLLVVACEVAHVALGGEAPQLPRAGAVGRLPEGLGSLQLRQLGVPLVDRRQVERLLVAGVVEVVLLVQLGDETVGLLTVSVELCGRERARHGLPRITRCARSQSEASAVRR
jgi:hypothetical protein